MISKYNDAVGSGYNVIFKIFDSSPVQVIQDFTGYVLLSYILIHEFFDEEIGNDFAVFADEKDLFHVNILRPLPGNSVSWDVM